MIHSDIGVNGEPEHNANSIFCWCAPRIIGNVVIHRSLIEIVESAIRAVQSRNAGDVAPMGEPEKQGDDDKNNSHTS